MESVPYLNTYKEEDFPPPTVGALTRLTWLLVRERIYAAVLAAGYDDLQPAHVLLFGYPTIADMRPSELAQQRGLSKQTINDLLRQMEAKGYLELRQDPSDGRARLITLTARGSELADLIRSIAQDIQEEWARVIGIRRYEALRQSLLRLIEAANSGLI